MTRKDYITLANALNKAKPKVGSPEAPQMCTWRVCCNMIADALADDNSGFDYDKFFRACKGMD